jgi:hypothetical protein
MMPRWIACLTSCFLTGNDTWNPACIEDEEFSIDALLLDTPSDTSDQDPQVNDCGECAGNIDEDIDLIVHQCRFERHECETCEDILDLLVHQINQRTVSKATVNIKALRPNLFGWLPIERASKKTIQSTTHFALTAPHHPFRKHCCACCPAANVDGWNEDVARTPLLMMMAFLGTQAAPWPRFMLVNPAPRLMLLMEQQMQIANAQCS